MSNICHNCIYHEKCMSYRYKNIKTEYMEKISREKNKEGLIIIYVEKCNQFIQRKFKYYPKKLNFIKKNVDN